MKRLLFFLCLVSSVCLGQTYPQANTLLTVSEEVWKNLSPNASNLYLIVGPNGAGLWRMRPNDRTTPASTTIKVHPKGMRFERIPLEGASSSVAPTIPYLPLVGTNSLAGSIIPLQNNAYDLGSLTYRFRTPYFTGLNMAGGIVAAQNGLYDVGSLTYRFRTGYFTGLNMAGGIVAAQNDAYDVGSLTYRFRSGYFSGKIIIAGSADSGENLQVTGPTRLNGPLYIGGTITLGVSGDMYFDGDKGVSRYVNDLILRPYGSGSVGRIVLQNNAFNKTFMHMTSNGVNVGADEDVHSSAEFQITTTTKGFLPPRLTAAEASAISSPAAGLMLYVNSTNGTFTSTGWWGYTGSAWYKF